MNLFPQQADGAMSPKVPPQDLHAEQAVLGSILLEAEAAERAMGMLTDADFYREAHRVIYRAMTACAKRREPVDLITVSAELRREGVIDEVGGPEYLTAVMGEVPTTAHVVRYAQIIVDRHRLRKCVSLGMEIAADAYDNPADVQDFVDGAERRLYEIACQNLSLGLSTAAEEFTSEEALAGVDAFVDDFLDEGRRPKTGLPSVDRETGGVPIPGLTLALSPTGFGKTTLAAMLAYEWSFLRQQPTAWFTTGEETTRDTMLRLAAIFGGVDTSPRGVRDAVRAEEHPGDFKANLRGLTASVAKANLYIQPRLVSWDEFAAETRRLVRDKYVRFVIVDYLERLTRKGMIRGDKVRAMEEMSARCQALQAELGIGLLVCSQLTEGMDGETKARYCAALENDAHLAFRIDALAKGTQEVRRGEEYFEVIIRKFKKGKSGRRFVVKRRPEKFAEETDEHTPKVHRDARDGLGGDD